MDFEDDDLWTVGFSNGESNVFRVIECLFKKYKMQVRNENSITFRPVTMFLVPVHQPESEDRAVKN